MTITGFVYDATSGQRIPAATLQVLSNGTPTGEGTVADANGNYTLSVADPDSTVKVSSIGYSPVLADASDADQVSLFPSNNQLPGVTVTAQAANSPAMDAWNALKPTIPVVLGIFVVAYLFVEYSDKQKKKARK